MRLRVGFLRVIAATVGVLSIGYAQDARPAPDRLPHRLRFTVSPQTTAIVAVDEDGYPDYLTVLMEQSRRGATSDNNAVRALLLTMPRDLSTQAYLPLIEAELEIDEQDVRQEFSKFSLFVAATRKERIVAITNQLTQQESLAAHRPWLATEFPILAEWLEYNREALDAAVQAATLTHWYSPPVVVALPAVTNCPLPAASHALLLTRGLRLRALLQIAMREVDAAWDDILAIHSLALLTSKGPFLTERYIGGLIEQQAAIPEAFLLQSPALTSRIVQRIRTELSQVPPLPDFHAALTTGERYRLLDLVASISRYGMKWDLDHDPLLRNVLNFAFVRLVNWNTVLQDMNRHLDQVVRLQY
jgi:hypothetical protein